MKKYKVKVNGKVYEVELEAVTEVAGTINVEPKKDAPAPTETPVATGEKKNIVAPIGGKVLDVKVSNGQSVKKGQVVCIIEAMKLENEVVAPSDGVVIETKVSKGASVATKDVLFVIG